MPCREDCYTHHPTPPYSGHSMFHLTSKWRNSSLVKHFEHGTNLPIPTTTQCKMYRVSSHLHNWITEWFQPHRGSIFLGGAGGAQNMRFSPWWKFRLWSCWLYYWVAW